MERAVGRCVSALGALAFGHVTTRLEVGGYTVAALGACAMATLVEGEGGAAARDGNVPRWDNGRAKV